MKALTAEQMDFLKYITEKGEEFEKNIIDKGLVGYISFSYGYSDYLYANAEYEGKKIFDELVLSPLEDDRRQYVIAMFEKAEKEFYPLDADAMKMKILQDKMDALKGATAASEK